jgi:hypothetical protein
LRRPQRSPCREGLGASFQRLQNHSDVCREVIGALFRRLQKSPRRRHLQENPWRIIATPPREVTAYNCDACREFTAHYSNFGASFFGASFFGASFFGASFFGASFFGASFFGASF